MRSLSNNFGIYEVEIPPISSCSNHFQSDENLKNDKRNLEQIETAISGTKRLAILTKSKSILKSQLRFFAIQNRFEKVDCLLDLLERH